MISFQPVNPVRRALAFSMLVVFLMGGALGLVGVSQAMETPEAELEIAQRQFRRDLYQDALDRLEALLTRDEIAKDTLLEIRILQARCLVQLDRGDEAEEAYVAVLDIDQEWRPEPHFTEDEIAWFDSALAGYETKKNDGIVTLLVGGVLAVGAAAWWFSQQ